MILETVEGEEIARVRSTGSDEVWRFLDNLHHGDTLSYRIRE